MRQQAGVVTHVLDVEQRVWSDKHKGVTHTLFTQSYTLQLSGVKKQALVALQKPYPVSNVRQLPHSSCIAQHGRISTHELESKQ